MVPVRIVWCELQHISKHRRDGCVFATFVIIRLGFVLSLRKSTVPSQNTSQYNHYYTSLDRSEGSAADIVLDGENRLRAVIPRTTYYILIIGTR